MFVYLQFTYNNKALVILFQESHVHVNYQG